MSYYDYRFDNARIFDSVKGSFSEGSLLIKKGVIEGIGKGTENACEVIDCKGAMLVPGLIDSHLFLNYQGSMYGIDADSLCPPSGVTAACDGGSCGVSGFEQFANQNISRSRTRSYALLNAQTFGSKGPDLPEEPYNPVNFRPELIERTFIKFNDRLRGLRLNVSSHLTLDALYGIGDFCASLRRMGLYCPKVVSCGRLPEEFAVDDFFAALEKDDVLAAITEPDGAHVFDADGTVLAAAREARSRGVLFDDCHARGHWNLKLLKKAFEQDFAPDIISSGSSLQSAWQARDGSLLYAMGVHLALGRSIEEVLKCVTVNPARALGLATVMGQLSEGYEASLCLLRLMDCQTEYADDFGNKVPARQVIVPLLTMTGGEITFRQSFFLT